MTAPQRYAALSSARRRFWERLERIVRVARRDGTRDPQVLEEAYELLVGETRGLKRALAAAREDVSAPTDLDR